MTPEDVAAQALRTGRVPPYFQWSWWEAKRFCWAHDVDVVDLFKMKRDLDKDLYARMNRSPWEAKSIRYPDGGSIIVTKVQKSAGRMVWSMIHELGHLLLGHQGIYMDVTTGAYVEATQQIEEEANRFTRALLLPADEMRTFLASRIGAVEIAKRKGVSFPAVMHRFRSMHEAGEFNERVG